MKTVSSDEQKKSLLAAALLKKRTVLITGWLFYSGKAKMSSHDKLNLFDFTESDQLKQYFSSFSRTIEEQKDIINSIEDENDTLL